MCTCSYLTMHLHICVLKICIQRIRVTLFCIFIYTEFVSSQKLLFIVKLYYIHDEHKQCSYIFKIPVTWLTTLSTQKKYKNVELKWSWVLRALENVKLFWNKMSFTTLLWSLVKSLMLCKSKKVHRYTDRYFISQLCS